MEVATPIAPEWEALAIREGAEIYTSSDQARVSWSHYGRGEIAIVEVRAADAGPDVGELPGDLPLFLERQTTRSGAPASFGCRRRLPAS
ncbi:MAG: hypothetical protein U0572_16625 [Phycisphaerales bacterium]